jgi:hypothetical protein
MASICLVQAQLMGVKNMRLERFTFQERPKVLLAASEWWQTTLGVEMRSSHMSWLRSLNTDSNLHRLTCIREFLTTIGRVNSTATTATTIL